MGITNNIPPSRLIQPGVIDNTAARPASPFEGQCIFQKDTDQLLVWNGTAWVIPNQTTTNPEGLELVKTQTVGSGVGSVTVSDVFSSTYDNYLIMLSGGTASQSASLGMRLGSVTTGYYSQYVYTTWNNTVASDTSTNVGSFIYVGNTSASGNHLNVSVLSPNLAKWTRVSSVGGGEGTAYVGFYNGLLNTTTQYTSFTLLPAGGTFSDAVIRVYGYRNS
jgi:hypothetical protein